MMILLGYYLTLWRFIVPIWSFLQVIKKKQKYFQMRKI